MKIYADGTGELATNSQEALKDPAGHPEGAAPWNRAINENQTHIQAVTACRDAIAKELGITPLIVQQLYDYNTLPAE